MPTPLSPAKDRLPADDIVAAVDRLGLAALHTGRAAADNPEYENKTAAYEAEKSRRGRTQAAPQHAADRRSNPDSRLTRESKARECRQAYSAQAVVCAAGSRPVLATNPVGAGAGSTTCVRKAQPKARLVSAASRAHRPRQHPQDDGPQIGFTAGCVPRSQAAVRSTG